MYHNTNSEKGATLKESNFKARTQEEAIYNFFKQHQGLYTAEEVHNKMLSDHPLTSTRRAISNLSNSELLYKSEEMKMGKYGKKIHCYGRNV